MDYQWGLNICQEPRKISFTPMSLDSNSSYASVSTYNSRGINLEWVVGIKLIMSDYNYNGC